MSCSGNYKNCCLDKFLSKCCINIFIIWHINLQCQTRKLIIAFKRVNLLESLMKIFSEFINSFLLGCTFSSLTIVLQQCKWGLLQLNILCKKKKKEAGCSLFGIFETMQVCKYWLPSIFAFCHQQMAVVALISSLCSVCQITPMRPLVLRHSLKFSSLANKIFF